MDFAAGCAEVASIPEFVESYNRLTGNNFSLPRSRTPLEAMIDMACGYNGLNEVEAAKFCEFFYEYVWSRLPDVCFTDEPQPSRDTLK